ncbi:MAG: 50S ribosomal protein L18 [Minisyncoccota bacterium]
MNTAKTKQYKHMRRHARVRAKISGTAEVPRLSVYKSNRFMYAQLIDDVRGVTIAAASDLSAQGATKVVRAQSVGEELAKAAQSHKIKRVVFDRGGFLYTGRVRALAEGARAGGLTF